MSENTEAQTSAPDSFLEWDHWAMMISTGLMASGALGWTVYKCLKSGHIDKIEILMMAASFAGTAGTFLKSSKLISKLRKSLKNEKKSIVSEKSGIKLDLNNAYASEEALDRKTCELDSLLARVNEMGRAFSHETLDYDDVEKIPRNIIKETVDSIPNYEDITKRLSDLNREREKNGLAKLPFDKMKDGHSEEMERLKTKFKEEIVSYVSEMKGYIQGIINPPARNLQFPSDMSDKAGRQIPIIINDYVDISVRKLGQVADKFVDSVCKAEKVCNNKDYQVKKGISKLPFPDEDSSETLESDIKQYYKTLENAIQRNPQMPPWQNNQRSRNASGTSTRNASGATSRRGSDLALNERNILTKGLAPQNPNVLRLPSPPGASLLSLPRVASPTPISGLLKPREENKPDRGDVEKLKDPYSKLPSKSFLNEEQKKLLEILKSEL